MGSKEFYSYQESPPAFLSKSWRRRLRKYLPLLVLSFFALLLYINRSVHSPRSHGHTTSRGIQHNFGKHKESLAQPTRLSAVRKEFVHAWTGYQDHGWMSDSLRPLSGQWEDSFCGLGATLVDSLDTLWIMKLDEEFEEAVNATLTINFQDSTNTCVVNLFETTIRHLGGLIGAYDLTGEARLLPKLVELGDMLHSSFNTFNGMPCSHCSLMSNDPATFEPPRSVAMAAQGSLYLEFARLSQITGDPKYMNSVEKLTETFANTQNDSTIPGMWPELVDATSVEGFGRHFSQISFTYSVGALSDSTYEYLVKGHLLLGNVTPTYARMWDFAARAIRKYILFRPQLPDINGTDILFTGIATRFSEAADISFEPRTEHLGCFAGGMFSLAGRIFHNAADMAIGEALTNGCVWAYENGPIGLMPETCVILPCSSENGTQCEWNETEWNDAQKDPRSCYDGDCAAVKKYPRGILKVSDARYLLRPEAIESVFYQWRMTGNEYWRDVGWRMFVAVRKHTHSPFGHASIENVMEHPNGNVNGGRAQQRDEMESFWFAETLKYYYLLFSEPELVSLDEYVLNTEAHPLKLTDGIRGF